MSPPPDFAARSLEDGQDDVKEEYCHRSGLEFEEGEEAPEFYDDWNDYEEEYGEDMEDWKSCCSSSEGSETLQLWPDPFDHGTEASSAPRTPSPSSLVAPNTQVLESLSVHWWQADATSLSVGLKVVCLSRPPGPPGPTSEVPDTLRRDFELAPSGCEYFDDTFQLPGHVESTPESLPAEGHMSGDFRVCPDAYWAAFHQRAWPNARRRFEGEKVFAPSKVIVGPKAGPRLVFSRRAHPRRPPGRQERRPGSRPTSRSFGASKAGAGAIRPSKEEPAANAGSLECRAAKTPCYEVTEEEFERLWLSGAVAPPIALGEVEDVYEIPEEDFDRLLKAGQLQLAKEDDFEVTRCTVKRPRQHPEEVLVSTLPAPVAKPMPPSTAPTPGRRYTEPMTARPRSLTESKKAFTTFPLSLERSLWSEAMLPRAVGSPARLLRGLRASISGSVVPLTETEAVTRSTAASSSKVDDTPVRRMTAGRLPRMPWEMQAMRKTSYSSGTDAGDSERSSPVQALRTLTPLDAPFPSHEDCG